MQQTQTESTLLTVSAAARELAIAEGTLRQWTRVGKVACQRTTTGRRLFDASEIARLVETRAAVR